MVWGSMSAHEVGLLHKVDGNMKKEQYVSILESNLLKSKRKLRLPRTWLFMQDNAPQHTAGITKNWLRQHCVATLDCPANSPELNPIEHLWAHLKKVYKGSGRVNKNEQFAKVREVWNQIKPSVSRSLVDSMPRRLRAVLKANGGVTKY